MNITFTIYMHEFPDGKKYIGMTSQIPERRWKNGEGYKKQKYFYREIKKYGWDNISHTILAVVDSKEEANKLERFYIAKYKSNKPEYGYNVEMGGEKAKGYKLRQETRNRMSESRKGSKNHMYGKRTSEEARKKQSLAHLGKKPDMAALMKGAKKRMGENAYNARKVSQLDNEGKVINTFPSMADASRAVGVRTQDIYSCCTGRQKTAHGYGWKYDEE